jgi:peptidyl-prolyl cis-trans isomerase A (cyclophilin A)
MRALVHVHALAILVGCSSSSTPAGAPANDAGTDTTVPATDSGVDLLAGCTKDPGGAPPAFDANAADDPIGGADKFTMAQALAGFPDASGKLTAVITTEKSAIRCTLDETAAPVTVANFVGLARGTRPYRSGTTWQVGRFYDGLTWHRVIPNFVIQGGDPAGTGSGGPGYPLVNENHVAEPLGTLAMAASTVPSGSQFYIVVGTGPAANYNVFGTCSTEAAIAIANVDRDANDRPKTPVHMQRIDIGRCP